MNDEVHTMASIGSHQLETGPVLETTSMSTIGNAEYQVVGNEEVIYNVIRVNYVQVLIQLFFQVY